MEELRSDVMQIIKEIKSPQEVSFIDPGEDLLGTLLDSLDFAILIMKIEDRYNSSKQILDSEKMTSVDAIVNYLAAR